MKLVTDTLWIFFGNSVSRLISGIFTIVLARFIGLDYYGIFVLALTCGAIFSQVADLGLQQTYIKVVNQNRGLIVSNNLNTTTLWLRVMLAIVSCVLFYIYSSFFIENNYKLLVCSLVVPYIFSVTIFNFVQGIDFSEHNMRSAANNKVLQSIGLVISCSIILFFTKESADAGKILNYTYGLIALAISVALLYLKLDKLKKINKFNVGQVKLLLNGIGGFWWTSMLYILSPQLPLLILQGFVSATVYGGFSLIYRLPLVLLMIPVSVSQSFYPKLFKAAGTFNEYNRLIKIEALFLAVAGLMLSLTLNISSSTIIKVLIKPDDLTLIKNLDIAFSVVSWLIAIVSLSQPYAHILMTTNNQLKRAVAQSCVLLLGAGLYFYVSIDASIINIAWATLIIELGLLFVYVLMVYLYYSKELIRDIAKVVFPVILICIVAKSAHYTLMTFNIIGLSTDIAILCLCTLCQILVVHYLYKKVQMHEVLTK